MDFRDLAIRDRDDTGYTFDIKHPSTGEPMTQDGQPCQVIIRGASSKVAAKLLSQMQQAMMEGQDDTSLERLQQNLVRVALPFVAGFNNCLRDGKPMTADDAEWWLDLIRWEIDLQKAEDPELHIYDKMFGHPFPVQVMRAVEASKATLGNA